MNKLPVNPVLQAQIDYQDEGGQDRNPYPEKSTKWHLYAFEMHRLWMESEEFQNQVEAAHEWNS